MGRLGSSGAAALDFTDGDTLKRFTIADAQVQQSSRISVTIQRSSVLADQDDPGWIYVPNVLSVGSATFDVLVAVLSGDGLAAANEFPNEVITLTYIID